jgi:hypothetical protein
MRQRITTGSYSLTRCAPGNYLLRTAAATEFATLEAVGRIIMNATKKKTGSLQNGQR